MPDTVGPVADHRKGSIMFIRLTKSFACVMADVATFDALDSVPGGSLLLTAGLLLTGVLLWSDAGYVAGEVTGIR